MNDRQANETVPNEMILASAGSGKTYRLTSRYIRLMALGADPERIIALTFTRKAAGEFLDEILGKLARAARDENAAADLAEAIGMPNVGRDEFLAFLSRLVERMPQLELGTLDGFFFRIVRGFPFELGLSAPPEILDENSMRSEKRRVFRRVFRQAGQGGRARREFVEAFKQATWGVQEKRLAARLDEFIERYHEVFLAVPDGEFWGNPRRIWPEGSVWLVDDTDPRESLETLDRAFSCKELTDAQRRTWERFVCEVGDWRPGSPWSDGMKRPLGNALRIWSDLETGRAKWTIGGKKLELSGDECLRLKRLVQALCGAEVEKKLQVTRGLYEILRGYEALYADLVRGGGRLTFSDILVLLSAPGSERPRLTQDAADGRLMVNYRLDGRYDHWLLDEFQDTSYVQWRALSDLIDEVVQDPEGRRSFFYVGDVKQAIFAWREGDARLFREIHRHYNASGGKPIQERRMSESWRSGPAVIDTVNRVFGNHQVMRDLFPAGAVERWSEGWDRHRARHQDRNDYVAFCELEGEDGRYRAVLELLREIRPLERGLSCAILVQRNRKAAELIQFLRRHGDFPVAAEADMRPGIDNPLGGLLLALFKWAAYPSDRFAREHLMMTPLRDVLAGDRSGDVGRDVLESVHRDGFAAVSESWIARMETLGGLDAFNRERGAFFVAAARSFDRHGRRSVAEFVEFMSEYTVRESAPENAVRVMTVHKSKGLGFDVVLLPDLEGTRLDGASRGLKVDRAPDRRVRWVLDPPAREIRECDPVLARHDAEVAADVCYERFCQLYVALTRAKRAMYLIAEPRKPSSKSKNFVRWLSDALGEGNTTPDHWGEAAVNLVYSRGNADWYRACQAPPAESVTAPQPESRRFAERVRFRRGMPSRARPRTIPAASLFSPESRRGLDFGTRVHEIFARVGWSSPGTADEVASWRDAESTNETEEAWEDVLACLRDPAILDALAKPQEPAELWRERSFEVILDGEWVTGTFDRVVLRLGRSGEAVGAEILDYKTDRGDPDIPLDPEASGYTGQLDVYRRVLAYMTGLPAREIRCRLLFTQRRELVDLPAER